MKVNVHYSSTNENIQGFKERLACVHAELIVEYIMGLNCSELEKKKLLARLIKKS